MDKKIILYVLVIIAIAIMINETMEIKEYTKLCKEYNEYQKKLMNYTSPYIEFPEDVNITVNNTIINVSRNK